MIVDVQTFTQRSRNRTFRILCCIVHSLELRHVRKRTASKGFFLQRKMKRSSPQSGPENGQSRTCPSSHPHKFSTLTSVSGLLTACFSYKIMRTRVLTKRPRHNQHALCQSAVDTLTPGDLTPTPRNGRNHTSSTIKHPCACRCACPSHIVRRRS